MISLFKKIIFFPYDIVSLFVSRLINPSKRTKHFVKNHNQEENLSYIRKKIFQCLKKNQEQKVKKFEITNHKSVFLKFTALFLVWLISIFIIFNHYSSLDNCKNLVQQVSEITQNLNFNQIAKHLEKTFIKTENAKFFPFIFFGSIMLVISLLWMISVFWLTSLLKVTNYFFAISCGCFFGSFYIIFRNKYLIFLFFIPLIITILVLSLITYLHQTKKIFKITDKAKRNFIILFTFVFFLNIFIQVFLFFNIFSFNTKTILMLVISLSLSILEFVFAAFMWAIALDELDKYVDQKLPKKYESLLVALMLMSFISMFFAIIKIIEIILDTGISSKKR